MLNNKKIFLLCALISICYTNAQTVELNGIVKDSLQNPLAYANVIARPIDSLEILKFAITDDIGFYKLNLIKNSDYIISISYLGFESLNFSFKAVKNSNQDIVLKEAPNQLNEVIIEMPVSVKEDTITYNVNKFTTGEERKLKQVLQKLPGVEVEKNGEVTVQGKKVTTMLVEGKKFFGGGSKLAVENIPADAIDKIQVLDNYNEIAFLKDLTDANEMAMNILLKEDKKRFLFGDVEVGKGNKEYYKAHSNLFYYDPKFNLNFIGNLNNTAEKVFTFKDFINFQGGINAALRDNGSIFKSSANVLTQFMENKDVISNQNQFGALNISSALTNKFTISGYGIFSNTTTNTFRESLNSYPVYYEKKGEEKCFDNLMGIGKLNFEYKPNINEQWYFKTQFKKNSIDSNNKLLSNINEVNNFVNTSEKLQEIYLNQSIEWHKQKSKKHTFSFVADYTFNKNNPKTRWLTSQPFLINWFSSELTERYELYQEKETNQNYLNTIFKHYWVVNKNNHIYFTLGNKFNLEKFYTFDSRTLEDGTNQDLSEFGFNNDVNYKINDFYFGANYKFKSGIFTLKQGIFLHQFNWKVNQQDFDNVSNAKFVLLPDFLAEIEFSNSESISVNYNLKSSFSDVSNFANRFYLLAYNSIYRGNELLENELFQTANFSYRKFSLYHGIMFLGGINYSKKFKGESTIVEFEDVNQFLTPVNLNNPEQSWSANLNLHKKIKNIKYIFSTIGSTLKYIQRVNSNVSTNTNNAINYKMAFKTLYENFPIIEVGFKQSFGKYTSSNQNSKFTSNEPYLNIDYEFLKDFVFAFDYEYYNYQNKTINQTSTYQLANTSVLYQKEDSAWTFKIDAQNLFDVKYKRSNYFSSYIISDTKTYILPRVLMISVIYKL